MTPPIHPRAATLRLALLLALSTAAGAQSRWESHATFEVRGAFESLLERLRSGDPVEVAFLGGSNTSGGTSSPRAGVDPDHGPYDVSWYVKEQHSFRARTMQLLADAAGVAPGQLIQVDASLGGTGSALAAFRVDDDVLARHPEPGLVVVEFVVNDLAYIDLEPEDDRSIPRSFLSLLEQIEGSHRDVALLFVLITVRGGLDDPTTELQLGVAQARAQSLRVLGNYLAEHPSRRRDIAILDVEDLFFHRPIPPEILGPLFLGEGDVETHKHVSPYGHELIARGAVELIDARMHGAPGTAPEAAPYPQPIVPFPVVPVLADAREILRASVSTGFRTRPSTDGSAIFDGELALYADGPGANLEFPFETEGTFDLWVQKRYGDDLLEAVIDVRIDDGPYERYSSDPGPGEHLLSRYLRAATGLAPGPHTVQITALAGTERLAFHAFLYDAD